MKKKIVSTIVAIALVCSFSVSVSAAGPETSVTPPPANEKIVFKLTESQEKKIREKLTNLDVNKETQDKLIKKIERGQLPDSDNPEMLKMAEKNLSASLKEPVKIYTFPDGSKVKFSINKNQTSGIQPLSSTCGSGYCIYQDYLVRQESTLITAAFLADFTINQGKDVADTISAVKNPSIDLAVGSVSQKSLNITRATEDIYFNRAASAQLDFDITYPTPWGGSSSGHLYLEVGQDSTKVWKNW